MDKFHMPKYLDQPPRIILWTFDEMGFFSVPFIILFMFFNSPILAVMTGMLMVMILKKIKGEEGHHYIKHLAYWHLPPIVKYAATPKSSIREILG